MVVSQLRPHEPRHAAYEMFAAGVGMPEEERVIEIVLDVFVSRGGDDINGHEVFLSQDPPKPKGRAKIERSTEVNLRTRSAADREVFTKAKSMEWQSNLSKEAVELVHTRAGILRSHIVRSRWVLTWKADGTLQDRHLEPNAERRRRGGDPAVAAQSPVLPAEW